MSSDVASIALLEDEAAAAASCLAFASSATKNKCVAADASISCNVAERLDCLLTDQECICTHSQWWQCVMIAVAVCGVQCAVCSVQCVVCCDCWLLQDMLEVICRWSHDHCRYSTKEELC